MKISQGNQFRFYIIIFGLSGFSGLIYESIWSHYLKLFLGHAAYAQTLVLAIFMGGMAIGAWICSRYTFRWKNLIILYAIIEILIGLLALLFHSGFISITSFSYQNVLPHLDSTISISLYKWTLSALLILPQSILLGMTFPLMSSGIIRLRPKHSGSLIAILYFANSFGAAFGVLASGFILIKSLGLPGTLLTAGLINIVIALLVWASSKIFSKPSLSSEEKQDLQQLRGKENTIDRSWLRLLLIVAFCTGMASFIYEIAWIRMLSLVLGSSTHAFELMLSAFIFGLAMGAYWIKNRIDSIKAPILTLANLQIIMGISALLTLPIYNYTFEFMQLTVTTLAKTNAGYIAFNLSSLFLCIIMLPATFCAGMTLPLISFVLIKKQYGEKSIGSVYAFNTIGAIVGVLAATHLLMPLLGLKLLLVSGVIIDITIGIFIYIKLYKKPIQLLTKPIILFAVISLVVLTSSVEFDQYKMASGVYRSGVVLNKDAVEVLYHKDGKTSSVDLLKVSQTYLSIVNNGKSDAQLNLPLHLKGTADEATMVLASVAPMLHKADAKNIAVIGMGSGLSSAIFLKFPQITSITTIEIEQAVIEAARLFGARVKPVYTDPRSKIAIEDAKTFFASTNKKFDIIMSEPSNPWVSGVAGLFSKEFYSLITHYLNKDGLFVQWVQLYEIDVALVASIFKAIELSFEDYRVYMADNANILIIASQSKIPKAKYSHVFSNTELKRELSRVNINNQFDLNQRLLTSKEVLSPLLKLIPIKANSDYFPVLDQNAAKTRFLGKNAHKLIALANSQLPVLEMLERQEIKNNVNNNLEKLSTSPHLRLSIAAYKAKQIANYLLSSNKNLKIANGYSAEIEYVRLFLNRCSSISLSNSLLNGFQNLAIATNPYLPKEKTNRLWHKIKSSACYPALSQQHKAVINLSASIALRDAKQMSQISLEMLKMKFFQQQNWKIYLLKVNMLANLARNKPALALNQFRFSGISFKQLWKNDLELALLLAHSISRQKKSNRLQDVSKAK